MTKKTFPVLLTLIFALSILACNHKTNKNDLTKTKVVSEAESAQFFTIDFAEIIKNQKEVPLSDIAKSVEFIQFENTDKALLGNVFDVQLTPEYFFIKHSGSRLLTQFDRNGKFIRYIGKEGRGPKEYGLMRKFSLDQENRLIYIHTNWTHKVMETNPTFLWKPILKATLFKPLKIIFFGMKASRRILW